MLDTTLVGYRAKVLVIDDDPVALALTVEVAKNTGFAAVLVSREGMRGIELYRDERPDAVALDLAMPEVSGLEVLNLLRREMAGTVLPIIVVSGEGDEEAELAALRLGALDVVRKPYSVRELGTRLRNAAMIGLLQRRLHSRNLDLEGEVSQRTERLERAVEALKVAEGRLVQAMANDQRAFDRRLDHAAREVRTVLKAMAGYAAVLRDQAFGPLGHPRYLAYAADLATTATAALEIVEAGFTPPAGRTRPQ